MLALRRRRRARPVAQRLVLQVAELARRYARRRRAPRALPRAAQLLARQRAQSGGDADGAAAAAPSVDDDGTVGAVDVPASPLFERSCRSGGAPLGDACDRGSETARAMPPPRAPRASCWPRCDHVAPLDQLAEQHGLAKADAAAPPLARRRRRGRARGQELQAAQALAAEARGASGSWQVVADARRWTGGRARWPPPLPPRPPPLLLCPDSRVATPGTRGSSRAARRRGCARVGRRRGERRRRGVDGGGGRVQLRAEPIVLAELRGGGAVLGLAREALAQEVVELGRDPGENVRLVRGGDDLATARVIWRELGCGRLATSKRSIAVQPTDHTSEAVAGTSWRIWITSGAIQNGVPTTDDGAPCSVASLSRRATPKSASFTWPSLVMSRLAPLTSPWHTPCEWSHSRPSSTCRMYIATSASGKQPYLRTTPAAARRPCTRAR